MSSLDDLTEILGHMPPRDKHLTETQLRRQREFMRHGILHAFSNNEIARLWNIIVDQSKRLRWTPQTPADQHYDGDQSS